MAKYENLFCEFLNSSEISQIQCLVLKFITMQNLLDP